MKEVAMKRVCKTVGYVLSLNFESTYSCE